MEPLSRNDLIVAIERAARAAVAEFVVIRDRLGYEVLVLNEDELRWLCHTAGPAALHDLARRRVAVAQLADEFAKPERELFPEPGDSEYESSRPPRWRDYFLNRWTARR